MFVRRLGAVLVSSFVAISLLVIPATSTASDYTGQVVNGKPVETNKWAAVAALVSDANRPNRTFFCGGTLVAPEWILTAAHCLQGLEAGDFSVVVGQNKLSGTNGEVFETTLLKRGKWNPLNDRNDIALVKLSDSATTTPMPLVRGGNAYRAGSRAKVLGWGATNGGGWRFPDRMQKGNVKMVRPKACREIWGNIKSKKQVCAGKTTRKKVVDTCVGDSGGPLVDRYGRLAGLTSYGSSRCAAARQPAVYTKVKYYRGWINRVIAANS